MKTPVISIRFVVLGASVVCWILLLINPGNTMTMHCHPVAVCQAATPEFSWASFWASLQMYPINTFFAGWIFMVLAMMLPKLMIPVQYVYDRSFKRYRFRHVLLFVAGYAVVWMAMGGATLPLIAFSQTLMPASYLPVAIMALATLVWQFSPAKQRCLNRGHNHFPLAAFGWAASRSVFRFGIVHGVWCVASGWLLMLLPMLLPTGHTPAMLFVTLIMISEHLEHPERPQWRLTLRGKLFRIIFAQASIEIRRVLIVKIAK